MGNCFKRNKNINFDELNREIKNKYLIKIITDYYIYKLPYKDELISFRIPSYLKFINKWYFYNTHIVCSDDYARFVKGEKIYDRNMVFGILCYCDYRESRFMKFTNKLKDLINGW